MDNDTYQRAQELFEQDDIQGAIALLEGLTRAEPANWRALNRLGALHAHSGAVEKAIGAFRRAVQLNSRSPKLRYNLGQACEMAGVPVEALHQYETALRFDPQYELARDACDRLRKYLKQHPAKTEE